MRDYLGISAIRELNKYVYDYIQVTRVYLHLTIFPLRRSDQCLPPSVIQQSYLTYQSLLVFSAKDKDSSRLLENQGSFFNHSASNVDYCHILPIFIHPGSGSRVHEEFYPVWPCDRYVCLSF
jgi:hypothetical protein